MLVAEHLPVDEAAEKLGIHRTTLYRWLARGVVKRYRRKLDRKTYVDLDEIRAVLEAEPEEA